MDIRILNKTAISNLDTTAQKVYDMPASAKSGVGLGGSLLSNGQMMTAYHGAVFSFANTCHTFMAGVVGTSQEVLLYRWRQSANPITSATVQSLVVLRGRLPQPNHNIPLSISSTNARFKPIPFCLAYSKTSSSNAWGILNSNLTISISPTNSLLVSWLCLLGFLVLPFWLCLLALALSSASLTNLNMSKTAWGGRLSDTIITPKKNIDVIIPNKPSLLLKFYQSVSSKLDIIGQIRYNVDKVLETPYKQRILLRLANLFLPITLACPAYTWASVSYGQDEPIREDGCTTVCVFSTSCPPLARNKGQISQTGVISNV